MATLVASETIFIDANVLLEAILQGRKYADLARDYISQNQVVISPLSAHLMVYFGLKDGLELDFLLEMLSNHNYSEFSRSEIMWASQNYQSDDFEDALQVGCAVLHGAKEFATFDLKLANLYKEFIKMRVLAIS